MHSLKRLWISTIAVLLVMVAPSVVSAQVSGGPSVGCGGDSNATWPDVGYGSHRGVIYSVTATGVGKLPTKSLAVDIAAGVYEIDTVSYDGGDDRADDVQPQEQYFLAFFDAADVVIDRTPIATVDLLDGVLEAEWAGSLGLVTLDRPAVRIQAEHASLYLPADPHPNSVMPICVGWTLQATPTTTTVASTTTTTAAPTTTSVAPTTTTVVPPTTIVDPPTASTIPPTTTPPTTTLAPATTTVPTQVLPEVQEMPDPEPVVGNPQFTG